MTAPQTFWNGEPHLARRVVVKIGAVPVASWWCKPIEGQMRRAVQVRKDGTDTDVAWLSRESFLLDDDEWTSELEAHRLEQRRLNPKIESLERVAGVDPDRQVPGAGCAWWKVTEGRGGPDCYHRSLPPGSIVVSEVVT